MLTAGHSLSLVEASRGYSVVVLGLIIGASLISEHRL